jgi:hypothetical protein
LQGACEIAEDLFEGHEMDFGGVGLIKPQDVDCCGDIKARADSGVLEAAEEAGVDITGISHERYECGLANNGKVTRAHG